MIRPFLAAAAAGVCLACAAGCGDGSGDDASSRPMITDTGAAAPATPARPVDALPATFTGVLPCADCPGIEYTLNLMPDQTFFLRTVYRDRPAAAPDDLGRWVIGSDGRTLALQGGRDAPLYFEMIDGATLRKLDNDARRIASSASHDLRRAAAFAPLDARVTMRGELAYRAGDATFAECVTGRSWPVAPEGESATLAELYRRHRAGAGANPLVVSVDARVASRLRPEGGGSEPALLVERVAGAFPEERCAPGPATVSLEDTNWRLTQVRGEPVAAAEGRRQEPGLRLDSATGQFSGSGGCNRLLGSFRREGASLVFTPAITTRMACPAGMETEEALVSALDDVARWRILGRRLELADDRGTVVARFEAR